MDLGLKGSIAVVYAASRGLGCASAAALAAEGCDLAFCLRDAGRIEAAAVAFLASQRASFISGTTLLVDAAQTSHVA